LHAVAARSWYLLLCFPALFCKYILRACFRDDSPLLQAEGARRDLPLVRLLGPLLTGTASAGVRALSSTIGEAVPDGGHTQRATQRRPSSHRLGEHQSRNDEMYSISREPETGGGRGARQPAVEHEATLLQQLDQGDVLVEIAHMPVEAECSLIGSPSR
jgi:hypothetical protein